MAEAKAIFQIKGSDRNVGLATLGMAGEEPGDAAQQVHDGDTAFVTAAGNFGIRLLGVDAPEVGLYLPRPIAAGGGEGDYAEIGDSRWDEFLSDPFSDDYEPIDLGASLRAYLAPKVGPGAAENHADLAGEARQALTTEVEKDMAELGQDKKSFRFFLSFASEIMDGYGRLLGYLNRSQERPPRPLSYNERLLQSGWVTPYFIWPNLDPYIKQPAIVDAVPAPGGAVPRGAAADSKRRLDEARGWVHKARTDGKGVWREGDPLRLLPFELRYLARRQLPPRWVIDLSAADDRLLAPRLYHQIEHPEDRLFVPSQYVPLFVEKGWRKIES